MAPDEADGRTIYDMLPGAEHPKAMANSAVAHPSR
jgi:hypothetical protein